MQQRAQQGYEQLADMTEVPAGAVVDGSRSQRGESTFAPTLLDAAIEAKPLEHSARALLPIVARDLAPHRASWSLYAAFVVLISVAALVFMRLFR